MIESYIEFQTNTKMSPKFLNEIIKKKLASDENGASKKVGEKFERNIVICLK